MKFMIDTLGATAASGGMRLYAQELIASWADARPDDQVIVLGGPWVRLQLAKYPNVRVLIWNNESAFSRFIGQSFVAGARFWSTRSDLFISISPIASPLVPRKRRVCVIHDWRHLKNPDEFGFVQRVYRKLWASSANHAGAAVSISTKTNDETALYAPASRRYMVENGRDHARRWSSTSPGSPPGVLRLVTFGHHSNKRPELVIQALAQMSGTQTSRPTLTVLGARGKYAQELLDLANTLGVGGDCSFPGFVDEANYRWVVQTASVVILASSDEGFGLPIAEAQFFGIPVIATDDSGLSGIHDDLIMAKPTPSDLARALRVSLSINREAPRRAPATTWEQTAMGLRTIAVRGLHPTDSTDSSWPVAAQNGSGLR